MGLYFQDRVKELTEEKLKKDLEDYYNVSDEDIEKFGFFKLSDEEVSIIQDERGKISITQIFGEDMVNLFSNK